MANASGSSRRAALRAQQEAEARRKRMNRIMTVSGVVAGVAIIAIVLAIMIPRFASNTTGDQISPPNAVDNYAVQAYPAANPAADVPTVVIWEDFQCPFCKNLSDYYSTSFHELAEAGKIKLEYRLVAFLDSNLGNDASMRSAVGATIADKYGKFVEYTDAVYANQPTKEGDGYSNTLLRETIPTQIGLTGDQLAEFQALYDAKATKDFVDGATKYFVSQQVPGTPYVTVNGKEVQLMGQSNGQLAPATELNADALLAYLQQNA